MLTTTQLQDIETLQKKCESEDNIKLKLNWDILKNRSNEETEDFFEYDSSTLVGFVGLYGFGDKVEICGMIHPKYRKMGIFTRLFNAAIKVCHIRNYKEILLNSPANSKSAITFLQKVPCVYSTSEYQMKYHQNPLPLPTKDIILRLATTPEDKLAAIRLDIECFGYSKQGATSFNDRILDEGSHYIIETNEVTVGKIRIHRDHNESWIYGFAVFPKFQGKGIGRTALTQVVQNETKLGKDLFLEVEVRNKHALGLYESCGFVEYQTQDYYKYIG